MPAWSNLRADLADIVERHGQPPFAQRLAAFRPARELGLHVSHRQFAFAQPYIDEALDGRVQRPVAKAVRLRADQHAVHARIQLAKRTRRGQSASAKRLP